MINSVTLTGRITNTPVLHRTNSGTPYLYITLAVTRKTKKGIDETDFIDCKAWNSTAEVINNYLRKGSLIGIEGSLNVFSQEKNKVWTKSTTVNISKLTFLEKKLVLDSNAVASQNGDIFVKNVEFKKPTTKSEEFKIPTTKKELDAYVKRQNK